MPAPDLKLGKMDKKAVVQKSRLRLAQRILITAAEQDNGLLTDDNWQGAMKAIMALMKGVVL